MPFSKQSPAPPLVRADNNRRNRQHRRSGQHAQRVATLYPHEMKLVQLSPQSVENMMTRPESMPLSLDDRLTAIPMNWREQTFGQFAKSA
jgi:hypothetical protein